MCEIRATLTPNILQLRMYSQLGISPVRKRFKAIKRGCTTPLEGAWLIIRPRGVIPICIGNKQTSFTPRKFSAMQLGIHNLYMYLRQTGDISAIAYIYNTQIPSCIVTHFSCVNIHPHFTRFTSMRGCAPNSKHKKIKPWILLNQTRTEKQMRAAALRHRIYFFSLSCQLFWYPSHCSCVFVIVKLISNYMYQTFLKNSPSSYLFEKLQIVLIGR